jgi:hypothetical protein
MSYPLLSSSVKWSLKDTFKKTPLFNSIVQAPSAGRGIATASLMPYPAWAFDVSLPWSVGSYATSSSILALFVGMYIQCNGRAGFFLFNDVTDNTVATAGSGMLNVTPGAASPMGLTGDGVSTQFQLARQIGGGGWDIIQNLNGTPTIKVNGTSTGAYTMSNGVITFTSAPASGATLTWSGGFYFLCQFEEDTIADLALVAFNIGGSQINVATAIKFRSVFI